MKSGPEVIKLFSCSTQLKMKFLLLINVKMPTIVGILTFMNKKNSILGLSESKKLWISRYFYTYEHLKFHDQLSWAWKKFYNLRSRYIFLVTRHLIWVCTLYTKQNKCICSTCISEFHHQVEVLQAEVVALKQLVLTSTPSSPNKHLNPQIDSSSNGEKDKKEKKTSLKPFWRTHRRSTSHHQFTKEDRLQAEAHSEARNDRCKEVRFHMILSNHCMFTRTKLVFVSDMVSFMYLYYCLSHWHDTGCIYCLEICVHGYINMSAWLDLMDSSS